MEQQRYTMMEGDKKEMEKRGMERENELTSVRDSLRKVMEDLEETRKQANLTMQENKSLKNRVALAEEESMQMRTVVALAKQEKDDIESQTAELIKDLTTRLKASKEDRGLWEERAKKAVNDAERMERKAMEAEASRKLSEKTAKEEAAEVRIIHLILIFKQAFFNIYFEYYKSVLFLSRSLIVIMLAVVGVLSRTDCSSECRVRATHQSFGRRVIDNLHSLGHDD